MAFFYGVLLMALQYFLTKIRHVFIFIYLLTSKHIITHDHRSIQITDKSFTTVNTLTYTMY